MKDKRLEQLDEFIYDLRFNEKHKKTIVTYKNQLIKFIDWLGEKEINKEILLDYKDYLETLLNSKYKITSLNLNIVVVNKFVRFIGIENCKIKKFKTQMQTSVIDQIYEQEHKRILKWAKKLNKENMYLIIKIFALCGIRVIELKDFTVENVKKGYFKTYNKGKVRDILIRKDLRTEILHYCKLNKIETGLIFHQKNNKDKLIDPSTIWRNCKKIAGAARVNKSKIHPHAWRHLYAIELHRIGTPLTEISDMLGHQSVETTRIYLRTSLETKKSLLEKMYKKEV